MKPKAKKSSQWRDVWRRLRKNRMAMFGLCVLVLLVFLAFFADVVAPYGYDEQNYSQMLELPSWQHIMGTDNYGRDIFSRIVYLSLIHI